LWLNSRHYESLLEGFRVRMPDCTMVDELDRVIRAWKAELNS
jgi:hypothetical protein